MTPVFVPIDQATKACNCYCYANKYWVCKDGAILFMDTGQNSEGLPHLAPQCNDNKSIAIHLQEKLYGGDYDVVYLEAVFENHAIKEAERRRRERKKQ